MFEKSMPEKLGVGILYDGCELILNENGETILKDGYDTPMGVFVDSHSGRVVSFYDAWVRFLSSGHREEYFCDWLEKNHLED